jgi:hypothetical protein
MPTRPRPHARGSRDWGDSAPDPADFDRINARSNHARQRRGRSAERGVGTRRTCATSLRSRPRMSGFTRALHPHRRTPRGLRQTGCRQRLSLTPRRRRRRALSSARPRRPGACPGCVPRNAAKGRQLPIPSPGTNRGRVVSCRTRLSEPSPLQRMSCAPGRPTRPCTTPREPRSCGRRRRAWARRRRNSWRS